MAEQIITDEKDDIALKLSLEADLIPSLGKLFRQISVDYKTVYSITGQILNADVYQPELISILRKTYREASKKAGKELRNKIEIISSDKERINDRIDIDLLNFSEKEPDKRSNIITATTNRWLSDFTLRVIMAAILEGFFPSNQEVANIVSKRFAQRSKGRSKNIAVAETLNAVEGARLIEANGLLESGIVIVSEKKYEVKKPGKFLFRRWNTREDDRVRQTHAKANGQTVRGTLTPFQVGNSLLMYPGDTSLGADLKEIYGCRCFTEIFIG